MSHHDRNMRYLDEHRIIYRCFPWSDKPTEHHDWGWFYKDGTHQCYTLFNSRAIFKPSLKYLTAFSKSSLSE